MYLLFSDNKIQQYPYSLVELRRDNPSVSFPENMSAEDLAQWDVYPVEYSAPQFDPVTQEAIPVDPVWDEDREVWVETWQINDYSESDIKTRRLYAADYKGFSIKLNPCEAYQKIRAQATESLQLTVACTEFLAVLQDHKFGERNEFLFQQAFENVLGLCSLTDEDYQQLQVLMNQTGLGYIYTVWEGELPEECVDQECGIISGGGN